MIHEADEGCTRPLARWTWRPPQGGCQANVQSSLRLPPFPKKSPRRHPFPPLRLTSAVNSIVKKPALSVAVALLGGGLLFTSGTTILQSGRLNRAERQLRENEARMERLEQAIFPTGLFERGVLLARLRKATVEDVRRLLGEPDQITPNDGWLYYKRTRNPETGEPDAMLTIHFEDGRVRSILCSPAT